MDFAHETRHLAHLLSRMLLVCCVGSQIADIIIILKQSAAVRLHFDI